MDTRRARQDALCQMQDKVFADIKRMETRDINEQPFTADERDFHDDMVKLYKALGDAAFTIGKLPIDYHF